MRDITDDDLARGFDGFETGTAALDGASIAWRACGLGDAVLLIHGWPMTGHAWRHVAPVLCDDHRVIVPDYRGAGASSVPGSGYDAETMARDMVALLDEMGEERAHVVGHDIGMQVAVAMALVAPERVRSLTVMESVLPGLSAHEAFVATGKAWHFGFNAASDLATDLVHGREGMFFEHFYHGFAGRPDRIPQADRDHYVAAYASRERLAAGFAIYAAFPETAAFFRAAMPEDGVGLPAFVLCGERSVGDAVPAIAADLGASHTAVLPGVGHFVPEEAPDELLAELRGFWATT